MPEPANRPLRRVPQALPTSHLHSWLQFVVPFQYVLAVLVSNHRVGVVVLLHGAQEDALDDRNGKRLKVLVEEVLLPGCVHFEDDAANRKYIVLSFGRVELAAIET